MIETAGERNIHYNNTTNFTSPNWKKYDDIDRKGERILSQLRMGKSPLTMDYLQKIKAENSNKCKDCGDVEIDTTEHLITKCERWKNKRDQILIYNNSIRVLHNKPKQNTYLRSIGRL